MPKYLFVVGGVMSGVGKGIAAASMGRILKARGFNVTAVKIDPYINVDAGTMNPLEHGEVFVTDDGDETDQDIGNYERFLGVNITSANYMTTGRVYLSVIERERALGYGGRCVEVVPHVPEEVIRRIKNATKLSKADITLVEIGGTVGEYQNILFLEAARMMKLAHPKDVLFALVSYLPIPGNLGEMKTKPTQYAAQTLNSAGIQADFIIARASRPIDEPRKKKLAMFCNVDQRDIISAPDVASIYDVPLNFAKEGFTERILKKFGLRAKKNDLSEWETLVSNIRSAKKEANIAVIGKYFATGEFVLSDVYLSVIEALKHAGWSLGIAPKLHWINSEDFEKDPAALRTLDQYDGICVPGGFGARGVEGKISAIQYAREHKIPYFGLCYGMQLAVIEYARHVCGLKDANTAEVNPHTKNPVIHIMTGQKKVVAEKKFGGTMRLGTYPCVLAPKSISRKAYGEATIYERHRHRYEVNNDCRETLEKNGMLLAGLSPDKNLVEIVEVPDHPFFVGTQFHPEFLSRPLASHPLFLAFMKAAMKK